MSSFNLASLIAGTPSTSKIAKEVKPSGKASKKSFTHGINVILNHGTYKGYHASVVDFFPASINLMTSGRAYIQADKYGPLVMPGSKLFTDVGDSLIEQVIPAIGGQYVPIQLFKTRNDNQLRVGRVIDNNNVITRSLLKQGKSLEEINMMMENRNNNFVIELSLFDTSLISNLGSLNISADEADILADKLTSMQINSELPAPLEQLSQEVKTNVSLLDKIIHPEYFEDEIEVKVVFKRDLVGPQYYLNVSGNLGDIKMYNPTKPQYLVSYTRSVEFKPNAVTIEKEQLQPGQTAYQIKHEIAHPPKPREVKMTAQEIEQANVAKYKYYGIVKSGPYSGKKLEVVGYSPSHLELILSSNGKKISSHVIRKRNPDGNFIVDEQNRPMFESSLILPTHVFYFDLILQNNNYAQVNKLLANDSILVTEQDAETRKYSQKEITKNDIKQLQPGFKFNEKEVDVKPQEDIFVPEPSGDLEVDEETQPVYDEEDNSDSQEMDYATSPVDEIVDEEQPQKASFKDFQRTTLEERTLTEQEKTLKTSITNILKYLKLHDEIIDVYSTMDTVKSVLNIIKRKLKTINYTSDLSVTSNMKFIIVLIVIYDLIKTGFYKNLNESVSMLFPQYFSIKDIQADAMNDNIFFMKWSDDLTQEQIDESVNKIKGFRSDESNYAKIIVEILLNADKILQGLLGLHLNIVDRKQPDMKDLIPVGVNPLTGRRVKDEALEIAMKRGREATLKLRSQMVTVEDLLHDRPLPADEVPIVWSQVNMPIVEKFKNTIQQKAESQSNLKQDYLYIKENLIRAPFAIRDDPMKASVRKAFEAMYKTLLAHITQQNLKVEKGKKRMREEQEQIRVNRAKIASSKPQEEEDEDFEPQNTRSYIKEQQRRDTQRAITKATRAANRNAYMMKKQAETESEERDADEIIKKVNNNEPWWNQMDTSE